jgi:hypothetical protein
MPETACAKLYNASLQMLYTRNKWELGFQSPSFSFALSFILHSYLNYRVDMLCEQFLDQSSLNY